MFPTRRSFLAILGSVSVGLLFRRKLDRVLESLDREQLADAPSAPDQLPSGARITICPQVSFCPDQLVVPAARAPLFVIEDIKIGGKAVAAFVPRGAVPASTEISFCVRYVGNDPAGARFHAALVGPGVEGGPRMILPIDSGRAIVS